MKGLFCDNVSTGTNDLEFLLTFIPGDAMRTRDLNVVNPRGTG